MGQPNPPADPSATDPSKTPEPTPATPPATGDGAKGGVDALRADLAKERDKRQAIEQQLRALAPLAKLAEAIGVKPEPGQDANQAVMDRITALEKSKAEAELRALRAEVAQAKGLTAAQAKRLQGSTREELEADAADLLASFPAAKAGDGQQQGAPKPDPSQGARGGSLDLEAQIRDAEKKGDWRTAMRLQNQKLNNTK